MAIRNSKSTSVFAQLMASFILAQSDPQYFVGVNLVGPENDNISLCDYKLHMQMIRFLRSKYPSVKVSLHAGELAQGRVSRDGMLFHISEAVSVANADRVGHGIDITYENNYVSTLNKMAQKGVVVEIAPTSEAVLWHAVGETNPIMTYLEYKVPIVISTDDAGTFRTDLSKEFEKVFLSHNLSYKDLKSFIRNSISYSFLPSAALWQSPNDFIPRKECLKDHVGERWLTPECANFLKNNQKAMLQWKLEMQLNDFENHYLN